MSAMVIFYRWTITRYVFSGEMSSEKCYKSLKLLSEYDLEQIICKIQAIWETM